MILLHPYAETLIDHPRLAATWRFLRDHETVLAERGWQIVHQPCGQDTRYEDGLKALWGQDDLVILEQDLEPTLEALFALEPAHHPLCAQAYALYLDPDRWSQIDVAYALAEQARQAHPTDPKVQSVYDLCAQSYALWHQAYRPDPTQPRRYFSTWAHRVVDRTNPHRHQWIADDAVWADYAGFGLIRITRAFQTRYAPGWRRGSWDTLDTRFSEWVYDLGIPVHIHWPAIPHHHHCPCHDQEG